MLRLIAFLSFINLVLSCSTEDCKIDYHSNGDIFNNAVEDIYKMDLDFSSEEPYYNPILFINEDDVLLNNIPFKEIDFIECHQDGTIIFQGKDCNSESSFRNIVYSLVYSPKGELHIQKKRNLGDIKKIDENWYLCKLVNTLAN